MATTVGQFIDVNAQQRLVRQHPNVMKLRPGVVRRTHPEPPEPDRRHVDTTPAPPEPEPAPEMAAKKKKVLVSPETRSVAVARVDKLIAAGNPAGKAVKSVAKELGVGYSTVEAWRVSAKKKAKKAKKASETPAPRASEPAANGYAPGTPTPTVEIGEAFLGLVANAVGPLVRQIVREEIRRMLS